MATRRRIAQQIQDQIRERADGLCEYCHAVEKWQYVLFTIDHVVSIAQGGTDDYSNLALACFHCNRHKSNHEVAIDPVTESPQNIFNPREEKWAQHFVWSMTSAEIIGLTPTGRATIYLLRLNRPRIQTIRLADALIDRHPPANDPILTTPQ